MHILTHPAVAAFLREHSNHSTGNSPCAVFDCDGTVIKGDIGEAMYYRQIERFLFRRSPADVWPGHPQNALIDSLYRRLARMTETERTASAEFGAFADLLISWYVDQIAGGQVIKACADIVRLFAGFTPGEVRAIARETFADERVAPLSTRRLGSRTLPRGVRYLREGRELAEELLRRGFEVWAVSGSNRWSVEPVFEELGIPPERVIGLEMQVREGVLTTEEVEPVPIREGKITALRLRTSAVPLLVASDSKNDIPLFLTAKDLKVRINSRNRDTADFFRSPGVERDSTWVLVENPELMEAP